MEKVATYIPAKPKVTPTRQDLYFEMIAGSSQLFINGQKMISVTVKNKQNDVKTVININLILQQTIITLFYRICYSFYLERQKNVVNNDLNETKYITSWPD